MVVHSKRTASVLSDTSQLRTSQSCSALFNAALFTSTLFISSVLSGCTGLLSGAASDESEGAGSRGNQNGSDGDGTSEWDDIDRTEPFTGPIVASPRSPARFSRLTHAQYENTVHDLLRNDGSLELANLFVAEPLITTFDTDATHLLVSSDLRSDYERAAETVAEYLVSDGAALQRALGASVVDEEDAEAFIDEFGKRAFRRPLSDSEKARLTTLFSDGTQLRASGDDFLDGVFTVVSYLLQSPHFLYRAELSADFSGDIIPLSPFEVAAKLSYALTASMPDDALFLAAESGALTKKEEIRAQALRLLDTEAGKRVVQDYHAQLLKMRDYEEISKNVTLFPDFGEGAAEDLVAEPRHFVHHVVFESNLGLKELLTADYTFANGRIARLYGLPEPSQPAAFSLLPLPGNQRAGLLTQIGFLAAHAEGTTPNSILRGVAIAHNILCADLPPPPDDVPALDVAVGNTNRERIENLTSDRGCAGCHGTYINPLGFAFEALDGVGAERTEDNGYPVDASSSYTVDDKEVSFNGPVELMNLLSESSQTHDCYAQHMAQYLFGRPIDRKEPADEALIVQGGWLSQSDAPVKELIVQIITTDAFLARGS